MLIYDPNGNAVPLGRKLGGGGEAEIFDVSDQPQYAAKVYRNPTPYGEAKLQAMVASPPHDPTLHLGHPSICWPKFLLFNQAGTCVGFLMHRVDVSTHVPAFKLYNPQDRQGVSLNITWKYLVRFATNITAALEAIHAQGHVIGDFNESNILVANSALVTLVDCDSMQIRDPSGNVCFRCPVGKPEFTPPELQGCEFSKVDRTSAHDNFGLGVMLFLLLMEGVHPFSGVWQGAGNPPVLGDRIRDGCSPYAGHGDVSPMPAAPPFELLPEEVRALFVRCFRDGHADPALRPAPPEWKAALSRLEENLAECLASDRHPYSNHLSSCPWCERKAALGGIDPFPFRLQRTARKPAPAAAPDKAAGDLYAALRQSRRFRTVQLLSRLKRPAAAVALLVLAWVGWGFIRVPLSRLWSLLGSVSISDNRSNVRLTPPLVCTGIGPDGAPMGVAGSFSEDQVKSTGVGVFLTYSGAVPQKDKFQIRWDIEGRMYESRVQMFERKADILYLNLGKDLPVGTHKIEFLVDGTVQQTASVVIEADLSPAAPRYLAPRQRAQPAPPGEKATQPAERQVQGAPPATTGPWSAVQPANLDKPVAVAQPAEKVLVYHARHWHGLGSCEGEMKLSPLSLEFTSEQHMVVFDVKEVRVEGDGIEEPGGRSWRFRIEGTNVGQLLARWKRGELFASAPHEPAAAAETQLPRGEPASAALPLRRTYAARHKHTLGSCSGELTLAPGVIVFVSREHRFEYQISDVQVDRNGILDRNGKPWRFDITGVDIGKLLREWKAGKLFPQDDRDGWLQ